MGLFGDASVFSQYVGSRIPAGAAALPAVLTGALHAEMRLWPPRGPLPRKYQINDENLNAWRAMTSMGVERTFDEPVPISPYARLLVPGPQCAIAIYDKWLLDHLIALREIGRGQPGAIIPNRHQKPSQLATCGLAQKLINIYIKYIHCWEIAGQYNLATGAYDPFAANPTTLDFSCALHAPIDNEIIIALAVTPLGHYLKQRRLITINGRNGRLVQADGSPNPWTKLDCLRTYFGFELILRRLAMHSWPKNCGCTSPGEAVAISGDWFEKKYADDPILDGPDWIRVAQEIPDDIFEQTLAPEYGMAGGDCAADR